MKQFACWFTHGVGNGTELRRIVHAARTPSEVLDSVEQFFAQRAAAVDHQTVDSANALLRAASEAARAMAARNVHHPAVVPQDDCSAANNVTDRSAVQSSADREAVQENEATPHGPAQLALEAEVGT